MYISYVVSRSGEAVNLLTKNTRLLRLGKICRGYRRIALTFVKGACRYAYLTLAGKSILSIVVKVYRSLRQSNFARAVKNRVADGYVIARRKNYALRLAAAALDTLINRNAFGGSPCVYFPLMRRRVSISLSRACRTRSMVTAFLACTHVGFNTLALTGCRGGYRPIVRVLLDNFRLIRSRTARAARAAVAIGIRASFGVEKRRAQKRPFGNRVTRRSSTRAYVAVAARTGVGGITALGTGRRRHSLGVHVARILGTLGGVRAARAVPVVRGVMLVARVKGVAERRNVVVTVAVRTDRAGEGRVSLRIAAGCRDRRGKLTVVRHGMSESTHSRMRSVSRRSKGSHDMLGLVGVIILVFNTALAGHIGISAFRAGRCDNRACKAVSVSLGRDRGNNFRLLIAAHRAGKGFNSCLGRCRLNGRHPFVKGMLTSFRLLLCMLTGCAVPVIGIVRRPITRKLVSVAAGRQHKRQR